MQTSGASTTSDGTGDEAAPLPFVSIVLPVLNGAGRIEHALTAMLASDYPKDRFEIIVADGRSWDRTRPIAEALGARVIDNPGITVAAGRNAGLRAARGVYVAFSEDDIVVPPGWLRAAVETITSTSAAGVGGPTPIPAGSRLWPRAVNAVFRLASSHAGSVQSDHPRLGDVDDLPGGNAIYEKRVLDAVGPIDERLTTAEDVDMHRRIRDRGSRLVMTPAMTVVHHKRDTVRGFFVQMARFAAGRVQLARRGWPALSPLHHLIAYAAPPLLAALFVLARLDGVLLGVASAAGYLGLFLLARSRRESLAVATLFPSAVVVFAAGWSYGYWSETLLPSASPRRPGLTQKLQDAVRLGRFDGAPVLWAVVVPCLIGKLLLLGVLAQRWPFVMDEFQQGGYAQHIRAGYYSAIVPFKTVLFTYLYYPPLRWFSHAREQLLAQRAITTIVVCLTLWLFFGVSRRLGRSRWESLFVPLTMLSFSTFIERSFELRSEPTALMCATLALWLALTSPAQRWNSARWVAVGLALGAAFLSTQKACWFAVSIGAGVGVSGMPRPSRRARASRLQSWWHALVSIAAFKPTSLLALGYLLAIATYSLCFPPATPIAVLRGVFLRSSHFAAAPDAYGDLSQFIVQTWVRNWFPYIACGLGFLIAAARLGRDPRARIAWVTSAGMASFVLSWKEPWPYVFTWFIPFAALWAPELLRVVCYRVDQFQTSHSGRKSLRARIRYAGLAGLALMLSLVFFGLPRNCRALGFDNQQQLAAVARLEALLAPQDSYQDGIGTVSTRTLSGLVWWDASAIARISKAAALAHDRELEASFADNPKVLVNNYRIQGLFPYLSPFIRDSYVPIQGALWLSGVHLQGASPTRFRVRWPGIYRLADRFGNATDGAVWADEQRETGVFRLALGWHEVKSPGCDECVLLPADVLGRVTPQSQIEPARLFEAVYTR